MKKISMLILFAVMAAGSRAQTEDYYGPVTISFHGFVCNKPTNDDPLGFDGVGDEVLVQFWDWTTVTSNRAHYNGLSRIYGENFFLPDRVKAGSCTINGGLKAGDRYFREGVYGDADPNILSKYAIVTTFCAQNTLIVILPTIWERDEGSFAVTPLQNFGVKTQDNYNDMTIRQKFWNIRDHFNYNSSNPLSFIISGGSIGFNNRYAGLFTANKNKLATRPVGLMANWDFDSKLLVLTPKTIKKITETDYGFGKGIIPVNYNEEAMGNSWGHGNYTILLRVVADIKDRNASTPPPPRPKGLDFPANNQF